MIPSAVSMLELQRDIFNRWGQLVYMTPLTAAFWKAKMKMVMNCQKVCITTPWKSSNTPAKKRPNCSLSAAAPSRCSITTYHYEAFFPRPFYPRSQHHLRFWTIDSQ